jgi:cytosine/adenosine deaminase-related metal-dependent hydrolase
MRKLQANYLFNGISAPIPRAIVVVDEEGFIAEIAQDGDYQDVEYFEGVLCPGFINTHCHLELSMLHQQIPQHTGLPQFVQKIAPLRNKFSEQQTQQAIAAAEQQMIQNGIVAVGDIANNTASFAQKKQGNLYYHTFIECFALDPKRARTVVQQAIATYHQLPKHARSKGSLAPHAPYTASLELFLLIKWFNTQYNLVPSTIHHQECYPENDMFRNGTGEMVDLYRSFGTDISTFFEPIHDTSLTFVWAYFAREGKNLLVHNTVCGADDVDYMMENNPDTYWCFCPNANLYIENKLPNFSYFLPYTNRLTLGTDSLASNTELSILAEMKTIAQHAPYVSLEQLMQWATINGARLLNLDYKLGSIEVDKQPGINLITHLDANLQLTQQSTVKVLE